MVKHEPHSLDPAFGALAHPIRPGILARLAAGEASVSELGRPFKVTAPAITRHLEVVS
jgi:DNA-binding transcriptional ArsR family regulator